MRLSITDLAFTYAESAHSQGHLLWILADAEILGVVGPNGSGKSTLIRCIDRILEAPKGKYPSWTRKTLTEHETDGNRKKHGIRTPECLLGTSRSRSSIPCSWAGAPTWDGNSGEIDRKNGGGSPGPYGH